VAKLKVCQNEKAQKFIKDERTKKLDAFNKLFCIGKAFFVSLKNEGIDEIFKS